MIVFASLTVLSLLRCHNTSVQAFTFTLPVQEVSSSCRGATQRITSNANTPFLSRSSSSRHSRLKMSDWSDFAMDDDDDDLENENPISGIQFADENDTQEEKAAVGSSLKAPEIFGEYEALFVPQGTAMELSEEHVERLLAACRQEIGTVFGYTEENRGVGITGGVDFVELDGPTVVLALKGRFWHTRPMVLARVGAYLQGRIPEIIDVVIDDPYELTDEANKAAD
jgi:hypothetical protein